MTRIFDLLAVLVAFLRGGSLNYVLPFVFDLRGIVTVLVTLRVLFTMRGIQFFTTFVRRGAPAAFAVFLLIGVSSNIYDNDFEFVKALPISLGLMMCTYFFQGDPKMRKNIFASYCLGSLLISLEAIYNVVRFRTLPTHHIFSQALGLADFGEINHNTFGFISMITAILLIVFITTTQGKRHRLLSVLALFISMMGILLSTSRSAILALFFTYLLILLHRSRRGKHTGTLKLLLTSSVTFGVLAISIYFMLSFLELDQFKYRLINEPISKFGIHNGIEYSDKLYNYDEKGESIYWREELLKFLVRFYEKEPLKLFLGGKIPGLKVSAHNMFFNIVIDTGLLGLCVYVIFIVLLIKSFMYYKDKSDFVCYYIFTITAVLIYCQGQNREYMDPIMFALLGGYSGEVQMIEERSLIEKQFNQGATYHWQPEKGWQRKAIVCSSN